ncbi:MAG: LacI family DNA-binding transcriptional regulator, partial [Planctomycetes bacterium]|nr:LacI family DNA-binding transcriptional regulator [Planctomycetota bacterium]
MNEIARLSGVSQATVSRVVNDPSSVAEETVLKVREVMAELGYSASRRKTAKAGMVAYLNFEKEHPVNNETLARQLRGINRSAAERGLALVVVFPEGPDLLPRCLLDGSVCGVILAGSVPDRVVMERIAHLPRVWLTSYTDGEGDHALEGNALIGRLAATHFIKMGLENLAHLNVHPGHPAVRVRGERFRFR